MHPDDGARGRAAIALFPLVLGLIVLALAAWPYIEGLRAQTPDLRFSGFIDNVSDSNPYVSWVRQAAAGRLRIESLYSPEPVEPHLVNLMTLKLGTLARVTGMSPGAAFAAGRVLFGALLLWVLWWTAGVFLGNTTTRRFAWAWMTLGAGAGWIFVLVKGRAVLDPPRPLDLRIPEATVFGSLLTMPHLAASLAAMVAALVAAHLAMTGGVEIGDARDAGPRRTGGRGAWLGRRRVTGAVAVLASLALGGFHPYPLLVVAGTIACELGILAARRRIAREGLFAGALALAAAAAGLGWNVFMFSRDPVLAGWRAQNVTPSLHPLQYLLGLGAGLWLLPVAAVVLWRKRSREPGASGPAAPAPGHLVFLGSWIAVTLALTYAPLPFQRRLIEGIGVPLALVGAMAIGRMRAPRRAIAFALVLAISIPSSLLLVARSVERARSRSTEWFVSRDDLAACRWLGANAAHGSVVLAAVETANRIPRYADCRVFAGHFCQTVDFARRARQVQLFFAAPAAETERAGFLGAERIEWLVWGAAERRTGTFDPRSSRLFEEAFRSGETAVYRVRR